MTIAALYDIFTAHPTITTDSRHCPKGSLFFALKGASFNGNDYATQALRQGCAYAIVDELPADGGGDLANRHILVDDVLTTLQQLARHHRRQLATPVVAITGTNGKTTTKELTAAVLTTTHHVLYTQGNLNNHIGVPLTLLRLTPNHDIAVIEMGANHPGEIRTLAAIAEPNYGLITNVGMAHLEGFGSFEGVCRTKGELYDYLRQHNGTAFLDTDNPHLTAMANNLPHIPYIQGDAVACNPYLHFRLTIGCHGEAATYEGQSQMIGAYNIRNIMAAATIGNHFGVAAQQICAAIEAYTPTNNRSELVRTNDNTIIIDAYNANPTSMEAAITNFRDIAADSKLLILGDMGELGAESLAAHKRILSLINSCGFTHIWLVGKEFAKAADGHPLTTSRNNGTDAIDLQLFDSVAAVQQHIKTCPPHACHILVKGSNSTRLYLLKGEL